MCPYTKKRLAQWRKRSLVSGFCTQMKPTRSVQRRLNPRDLLGIRRLAFTPLVSEPFTIKP